jgi:hypothetical protein
MNRELRVRQAEFCRRGMISHRQRRPLLCAARAVH